MWATPLLTDENISYTSYIDLESANSDNITTPQSAANTITADWSSVSKIALDDYTPASNQPVAGKWPSLQANRMFTLLVRPTTGVLRCVSVNSSGVSQVADSTSALSATDGDFVWIRVDWLWATSTVKFYTATTSGYPESGDWSQLGSDVSITGTSGQSSSGPVEIGARTDLSNYSDGKFYYTELGPIGGSLGAKFNASIGTDPTYDNVAGQTAWTNNGGTPGSD